MPLIDQFGYVYLAQSGQFFKLGRSVEPEKRVGQISAPWGPVRLLHAIRTEDMGNTEAFMHARFHTLRLQGNGFPGWEWYALTDADVAWFREIHELTCTADDVWELRCLSPAAKNGLAWIKGRKRWPCDGDGTPARNTAEGHAGRIEPGEMFLQVAHRCGGLICHSRHCPACARAFFNFVRGVDAKQAKDAGAQLSL